jgi:integrase
VTNIPTIAETPTGLPQSPIASAVVEIPKEIPALKSTTELAQAASATRDKRKGPCMARRGQVGRIEISGNWYVVRFWRYPAGENRIHASERICPVDKKALGFLTSGERRIRANEILADSGVNDKKRFVETNVVTTFREQAEWFLDHVTQRRRNPAKQSTVKGWRYCVSNRLNPTLGELPLASVNNATVKALVAKMHEANLSAQTITTYVNLVKLIVSSALDDNGDELFPRKWNNEFIDVPIIENQKQPTFTVDTMSAIVEKALGQDRILFALLAGTGLRVGEAFGLEAKHLSPDCRTITVEQSCWENQIQTPKTKSARRKVDVNNLLAALLKQFVGDRQSGLLFANASDKPLSQTNVVRRSLHPILKELGIEKTGFHAMRRFRATWLRRQRAPEDLIRFWLGHAKSSVTDSYSKVSDDLEYRKEVAEAIGTGFTIPAAMIPRYLEIDGGKHESVAA